MPRNRFILVASLLTTLVSISACDSSGGALVSSDIKDLLAPDALTTTTPTSDTNTTTDNNPRANTDGELIVASPSPVVAAVSPTITVRGTDIVLLIQGANLPDSLRVNLDDDSNLCQVTQLQSTSSSNSLASTIEAVCTTSNINDRLVTVSDSNGDEIQGSPLPFTATSITIDSNVSSTPNVALGADVNTTQFSDSTTTSSTETPENQDDVLLPGLSQLAQASIPVPNNVRLLSSNSIISLAWNAVEDSEGYIVYRSDSAATQTTVSGANTYSSALPTIDITDVVAGETYYLSVSSLLNGVESFRSQVLVVTVANTAQFKYGDLTYISSNTGALADAGVYLSSLTNDSMDQSDDGRYTVFLSHADNLAAKSLLGVPQVFLHDKENNSVTLLSQSVIGNPANSDVSSPKISGDGSAVVFVSAADNLDRMISNSAGVSQVFMTNVLTATTSLVSKSQIQSTVGANNHSYGAEIDHDGSDIVFSSLADDLSMTTKTQSSHLYHLDTLSESITRVRTHTRSTTAGLTSIVDADAMTPDGQFVFYRLSAPGSSQSLHRVNLLEDTQISIAPDMQLNESEAYIHDVSNDGNLALLGFPNSHLTGLYSISNNSLTRIGLDSRQTAPKGLSGSGQYAVFWSVDDVLPNNAIVNGSSGNHYVLNTQTNSLEEYTLTIQSISNDGRVLLFTTEPDATTNTVQLHSIKR